MRGWSVARVETVEPQPLPQSNSNNKSKSNTTNRQANTKIKLYNKAGAEKKDFQAKHSGLKLNNCNLNLIYIFNKLLKAKIFELFRQENINCCDLGFFSFKKNLGRSWELYRLIFYF